jgi:hypothetical protein
MTPEGDQSVRTAQVPPVAGNPGQPPNVLEVGNLAQEPSHEQDDEICESCHRRYIEHMEHIVL